MGNNWYYRFSLLTFIVMLQTSLMAQSVDDIYQYFNTYTHLGQKLTTTSVKSYLVIPENKTINIDIKGGFAEQSFSESIVDSVYSTVSQLLPDSIKDYKLNITAGGKKIEDLVPNPLRTKNIDLSRTWKVKSDSHPWIKNTSCKLSAEKGFNDAHLVVWQSHGRYYKSEKNDWLWQRPRLFCTTEDLFTQTIVLPYIVPMLENAGAIVYTPRDRNWQNEEVIVDNDAPYTDGQYTEKNVLHQWKTSETKGFAHIRDIYSNGNNPFEDGTSRYIETVHSDKEASSIVWTPYIPKSGDYAVYVSYPTLDNSIDNATYEVVHKGTTTRFEVNQQIGGDTWVYLGTFSFDEGFNDNNKVILTNKSNSKGIVSADAVRFGCGMGNVLGGKTVSNLPRWAEAARYSTQWAGFSEDIYHKFSSNHYNDDLRARPGAMNTLAGGSVFLPEDKGRKVPFELSVAFHSDAGYSRTDALIGSLGICTTKRAKPQSVDVSATDSVTVDSLCSDSASLTSQISSIPSTPSANDSTTVYEGISRFASYDLASTLIDGLSADLRQKYNWQVRPIWDKNYAETSEPAVPSAILEMLSHQNFADMCLGYDPQFKFDFARSVYKSILRYVSATHGEDYIVQPLPIKHFSAILNDKGDKVHLSWEPANDPSEPTSAPLHYILYTRLDNGDFDNGRIINSTHHNVDITPGTLYSFRIVAANKGGVSFPSEVLSAYSSPHNDGTILIVNAFTRLEGPAQKNNSYEQGFDLNEDPGVQYGLFAGFCGRQKVFSKDHMGSESSNGTGYSGSELEGHIIMGNTFDYPYVHGEAIRLAGTHSFCSSSVESVISGSTHLSDYKFADIICGVQKEYNTKLLSSLNTFAEKGNSLIISGANLEGLLSEGFSSGINAFHSDSIKSDKSLNYVSDLNNIYFHNYYREMNEECYSVPSPSSLTSNQAQTLLVYPDQTPAAMFNNKFGRRLIICGFPLESLQSSSSVNSIMRLFLDTLKQ